MGNLIHSYALPHGGWDDVNEPSPSILHHSVVGMGALVIGGVSVGPNSYVAAGAVVTKDVPPGHLAIGVDRVVPSKEWRGANLRPDFWNWSQADDYRA
jgi:acetyltransferase-like isoleucine patch superfamily enzyme